MQETKLLTKVGNTKKGNQDQTIMLKSKNDSQGKPLTRVNLVAFLGLGRWDSLTEHDSRTQTANSKDH